MDTRWDPPPFPGTGVADQDTGTGPAARWRDEVARVVLHADGGDVWIDPVYDEATPSIQVVSVGQVARTALVCGWCWMRGHKVADLKVLEGSPVNGDAFVNDPGETVRVTQTDGADTLFALDTRTRRGCARCGAIDRARPDVGADRARLAASPDLRPASQKAPFWKQWPRMPWRPYGPLRGLHFSVLAPLAILTALVMTRIPGLPVPGWLPLTLVLVVFGDILVSTVAVRVRLFLEACGARFDSAHPFGDRRLARTLTEKGSR